MPCSKQKSIKVTVVKSPKANIKPCGDRIIVSAPPAEAERKEEVIGGIVIPNSVSNATRAGVVNLHSVHEVLGYGPDCREIALGMKVVLLTRDIFPFKVDGVEHYFTRAASVVAIVG